MKHSEIIQTISVTQTESCGANLARQLASDPTLPRFVALYGDLGVGKTAFVRGFASVLSPQSTVKSPSFALVNEYRKGEIPLFHFDMYRIEDEDELYSIGFFDYLDRGGICLVEWSENIPFALPSELIRVTIEKNDPQNAESRSITIQRINQD